MANDTKDSRYWNEEIAFLTARLNGEHGDIDRTTGLPAKKPSRRKMNLKATIHTEGPSAHGSAMQTMGWRNKLWRLANNCLRGLEAPFNQWTLSNLADKTSADPPDPASTAEWFAANAQPSCPAWEDSPRRC